MQDKENNSRSYEERRKEAMLVSVGFSIHRPEILSLAEPAMRSHDAVCLEEPETPGFQAMLEQKLPIEEYLLGTDFEYPVFSAMSCRLFQTLYAEGKPIFQVDPYMDVLARIHERFGAGEDPSDIEPHTLESAVYLTERQWYGALLRFYQRSMCRDFDSLVESVKNFGKADAGRGRLRDNLRAQAIADIVKNYESLYVEAGYIHAYLLKALRRWLPEQAEIRPLYLMENLVRELTGAKQNLGPGDILTIRYTYNPEYQGPEADLQAARSLVRIKILQKEEISENLDSFPHTRDEVEASRLVRSLSYEECRALYARIRALPTAEARSLVAGHVAEKSPAETGIETGENCFCSKAT